MKDMNGQTILLISDMRQVYLAEILTKKGMSVRCLDIRNSQTVEEQLLKLKKFLAGAAMLVLPIPVTKVPEQERLNEILNKNLANDTLVLGGCFTEEQRELLDRRGIRYLDFMEDEVVAQENAVATAEGAIAELTNHSPYNIEGAKILVTGYGNCGKAIAKKLRGLGARVTVLARLPRDAYILDIASKPGGTDFACAKEFGIRADLVLGIPGKYAPKESAYILERSMERFAAKQKSIDR